MVAKEQFCGGDGFPGSSGLHDKLEVECFTRRNSGDGGVELTVEGKTPITMKTTINTHYNGAGLEPWGERTQRGYGVEVIERFFREVAMVEFGGPASERAARFEQARTLLYNDLAADRQTVAAVQALEAILADAAVGRADSVVHVNAAEGGLVLYRVGEGKPVVLYEGRV